MLSLIKREEMNTEITKKTLHELIDRIEDNELLSLCVKLLEREISKTTAQDFFNTSESDLIIRAKASLKSIEEGKTRNIKDFKKDMETWNKNRSIS